MNSVSSILLRCLHCVCNLLTYW